MKFQRVKKILVIKLRHIGDVLLTAPTLRALREHFSDAHIAVLANSGTEDVLTGNTSINEIITFDRSIKHLGQFRRSAREMSFLKTVRNKGFDMTIDLTGGDRAAILSFVSGARYRLGWKPNKGFIGKKHLYTHCSEPDGRRHMVLQNLDIMGQFGIKTENLSVNFHIPEVTRIFVKRIFDENNIPLNTSLSKGEQREVKVVHVHPTSRWLFKCWRDEYMAEIIRWLLDKGLTVIVTSSRESYEIEKTKRILSLIPSLITHNASRLIDFCGKTSVKQLAAISEASQLFFGVDSAPMHIAAAVGTPVVALFGPSGAFNWGPWDNGQGSRTNKLSQYPAQNGMQNSGMHTVIQRDWNCVPCGKDGCAGSKVSKCLEDMTPEMIKSILKEKLGYSKR